MFPLSAAPQAIGGTDLERLHLPAVFPPALRDSGRSDVRDVQPSLRHQRHTERVRTKPCMLSVVCSVSAVIKCVLWSLLISIFIYFNGAFNAVHLMSAEALMAHTDEFQKALSSLCMCSTHC